MDWLKTIFSGGVTDVVKTVTDSVAQFIDTPEKQHQFEMAKAQAALELQRLGFEAEKAYLADRASAREMYKDDSSLQKVYAMTFLIGYMIITVALLGVVVGWVGWAHIQVPEWASLLVGSIFGAMSTKVSTITDFFFGSSQGSRDKDSAVQDAMKRIP
jgi:hypothetical protein